LQPEIQLSFVVAQSGLEFGLFHNQFFQIEFQAVLGYVWVSNFNVDPQFTLCINADPDPDQT
jgi:hypothetical protein